MGQDGASSFPNFQLTGHGTVLVLAPSLSCMALQNAISRGHRSRSPPTSTEHPEGPLESYEAWLIARGVTWDARLRLQRDDLTGWGLSCTRRIERNEKALIQVPPSRRYKIAL